MEQKQAIKLKEVKDELRGYSGCCPDCGEVLIFVEGCARCPDPSCGYSRCG